MQGDLAAKDAKAKTDQERLNLDALKAGTDTAHKFAQHQESVRQADQQAQQPEGAAA